VAGYAPGTLLGPIQVDLGDDITFGQVDGGGVAWGIGKLDGWGSPAVRTQYTDRQAAHGAWAGPAYYQARVMPVAGTVTAPAQGALETALEQLREAFDVADTLLTVHETVPKQLTVRSTGELLIDRATDRIAAWSGMLTAADPRRYSTTLQSASTGLPGAGGGFTLPITMPLTLAAGAVSGQITLTNEGTIATSPTFTITGPVIAPVVVVQYPDGSTRQLAYSDSLATGDTLVIDTAAHTAVLNGTASRRRYLSGTWPDIPPRSTVTVQWTASTATAATLTGSCRSAWK